MYGRTYRVTAQADLPFRKTAEDLARIMTSFAFILGVVPLITSSGPGAEMREAMGIAVFSGMLGVTLFGLIFTPVFYVAVRRLAGGKKATSLDPVHAVAQH